MQGLHEVLEQFLDFPSAKSARIAGTRALLRPSYQCPWEISHLFSLVAILRIVTVSKIRIQYVASVRTGSNSGEGVREVRVE